MSSAKTQLTGNVRYRSIRLAQGRQKHPVEAGSPERVARHRRRAEDGTGVGGDDVLAGRGAGHGVFEGRHLGDRVRIRARLLRHRGVLAIESAGRVEEGARAHGHHPPHPESLGRVEHVSRAVHVHGLEVGEVLAGPTEEGGTVDGGVGTGRGPSDVVGVGDVAGHHLDPQGRERTGVGSGSGERTDAVASFDQKLADVGAGQSGGTGDEDGLAHAGACSGTSE